MLCLHVVSVFSIKSYWSDSFASLRMFAGHSMFQGEKGWIHAAVLQKPEVYDAGSAGLHAGCGVSSDVCL